MWKIFLGFAIFAGLALWMLSRGGDIDIGGEKHGDGLSPTVALPASMPVKSASAL